MLLEARAITKTFGSFRAVDGVSIGSSRAPFSA